MKYFSKSHIFLYGVILIAVFVLNKTISLPYNGVIKIQISKQTGAIVMLDSPRNISNRQHISVDTLYFPNTRVLTQKRYGSLGFSENFFIDAVTDMHVLQSQEYHFNVLSDDGFRLKIDDKVICEHPENRPYGKTACVVKLSPGMHQFDLSYFQGGGPLGLHVTYGVQGSKMHDVGKNSEFIVFKERN